METLDRIFDLTGRVAVITGGNGGIGLGIAQALAATGCNVSIWGRNTNRGLLCDRRRVYGVLRLLSSLRANDGPDYKRDFAIPRRGAPELCMHLSP